MKNADNEKKQKEKSFTTIWTLALMLGVMM
jgi:hypothetical protein